MKLLVPCWCEARSDGGISSAVGFFGASTAQDLQHHAGTAALDDFGRVKAKRDEE